MILVTGASGHLGNVLVRQLLEMGERVRALVLPNEDLSSLYGLPIELILGNICDPVNLKTAFTGVDTVFHLASLISILPGRNEKLHYVNVDGTKNMLQCAKEMGVRKFIYTSSIHAIERVPHGVIIDESLRFDPLNPLSEYDRSKALASLQVLNAAALGLNALVVCPTGIIGPLDYNDSEMGRLIKDWLTHKVNWLIHGEFDFVDVRDVAQGLIFASERGGAGQTYILSGHHVSLSQLREMVFKTSGIKSLDIYVPFKLAMWIGKLAPAFCRLFHRKPRFTTYSLETVRSNSVIQNTKAASMLGYHPRPFKDTIEDTVFWWLEELQNSSKVNRKYQPHLPPA